MPTRIFIKNGKYQANISIILFYLYRLGLYKKTGWRISHAWAPLTTRASIQRWGSILALTITLSVYGADAIAEVKLLVSLFLHKSLGLLNQLLVY
jgi:hypothetical protein